MDRDLDQLQAAITHSENRNRSETIQLFDSNHFYYLEHPPTKEELLNTMVRKLVEDHYASYAFWQASWKGKNLAKLISIIFWLSHIRCR